MTTNIYAFDETGELTSMGASWFTSYAYYKYKDKTHLNWQNSGKTNNNITIFNRTTKYHSFWLRKICKLSDRLETNDLGLSADEVRKMARKLFFILNKKYIMIGLGILFISIIISVICLNSKVKFYIKDKTAFCSGKFPKYVCVDNTGDSVSGIMYVGNNELTIKKGKLNGNSKWYYKNNQLAIEENYKDGKLNGISKWYDEDGQVTIDENYKNDKLLNGIYKEYYGNGQLMIELNFKDGQLNGISKIYHENGQLMAEANFKDNILISGVRYNMENNLSEPLSEDEITSLNEIFKEEKSESDDMDTDMPKLIIKDINRKKSYILEHLQGSDRDNKPYLMKVGTKKWRKKWGKK